MSIDIGRHNIGFDAIPFGRRFVLRMGNRVEDLEAAQDLEAGQDSGSENLSSTEQGIYSGWTPYTSEEHPPVVCDSGSRMSAVQCSGSFCDNIRAYCSPSGGSVYASYWTSHVSEEGTNTRHCNGGYWVTGFACQGSDEPRSASIVW